jgi:hypothetical protein
VIDYLVLLKSPKVCFKKSGRLTKWWISTWDVYLRKKTPSANPTYSKLVSALWWFTMFLLKFPGDDKRICFWMPPRCPNKGGMLWRGKVDSLFFEGWLFKNKLINQITWFTSVLLYTFFATSSLDLIGVHCGCSVHFLIFLFALCTLNSSIDSLILW